MSGDIGAGATKAAVAFAASVAASEDRPPGISPKTCTVVNSACSVMWIKIIFNCKTDGKLGNWSAGYLQLAGGTNSHTVDALEREGLFLTSHDNKAIIAGVAYGGYARKVMSFSNTTVKKKL